jgi:hypothetical protein
MGTTGSRLTVYGFRLHGRRDSARPADPRPQAGIARQRRLILGGCF